MKFYNVELVDIGEQVENFEFDKVPEEELNKLLTAFEGNYDYLKFMSIEKGHIILERKYIRGIMYSDYTEPRKTTKQENLENTEVVGTIPKKGEKI